MVCCCGLSCGDLFCSGESWLILKNYPEFEYFRDIVFHFKFFLGTNPKFFPPVAPYLQKHAELKWRFEQGFWIVSAYGMPQLQCPAKGHRWPSYAIANRFTAPHLAITEDDILHLRELPDFDGQLGQRDSELLLSALTTPYLRIPLILSFFATEDRIHSLKSPTLRQLLDSVVFEPARYLRKNAAYAPQFVPTTDETCLATPYGLLLNELTRSPYQLLKALIRLLRLALSLDTGSYFASQTDIILYALRLGCRVENFVSYVLRYGKHSTVQLRDTLVEPAVAQFLEVQRKELRSLLEDRFQLMLRRWITECIDRAEALQAEQQHQQLKLPGSNHSQGDADAAIDPNANVGRMLAGFQSKKKFRKVVDEKKKEAASDFDALFQIASNLRGHVVITYRNCRPAEWDTSKMSRFLSLFAFLNSRHTWNANLLHMPEPELFEVYQHCRRALVQRMGSLALKEINNVMEDVVSVVTDSERLAISRGWGVYSGDPRHRGRYFVVESSARCALLNKQHPQRAVPCVDSARRDLDMGVEVSIQFAQLTLKANHLQALTEPVSSDFDVLTVFGPRSLQCAVVEDAQHRQWVRLIGKLHDLQYWDADARTDLQECDREYDPSEYPSTEGWIVRLFEPIRLRYYVQPVAIPFALPERVFAEADDFAYMVGLHPEDGGNLLEVVLCKSLGTVSIYYVESFGRRFWRTLMYSSDARFSLRFLQVRKEVCCGSVNKLFSIPVVLMHSSSCPPLSPLPCAVLTFVVLVCVMWWWCVHRQPPTKDRETLWPSWGRHEAGTPGLPRAGPSAVISREATVADNFAGTEEMFVPSRYLYGVLPSALLDTHLFWMDDNDTLRGYPIVRDEKSGLYEHVLFVRIDKRLEQVRYFSVILFILL